VSPISVVIPAYNEERVIGNTLRTLLADAQPGEFDVVVACNGCTDRTAEVAGAVHSSVRVIETEHAGKSLALNAGDRVSLGFPRVYADADILMDTESLRATVAALSGEVLAAAPQLSMRLDDAPWRVRQYFEVWRWAREQRGDLQGSGVYALSEVGRRRFDSFPDIIADDLFVYGLFSRSERATVSSATVTVTPPPTLREVVRVKARVFVGNLQYRATYGAGTHGFGSPGRSAVLLRLPPRLWPGGLVFAGVGIGAGLALFVRSHKHTG